MNIKLLPFALFFLLLGHHLMSDVSLHSDYIGFGFIMFFIAGVIIVLALEPLLGRKS